MQFNVWVNDNLIKDVEAIMRSEGKKRNTVINEAIAEYVKNKKSKEWSEEIKNFKGIEGLEDWEGFESYRKGLKEPRDVIFGEKE